MDEALSKGVNDPNLLELFGLMPHSRFIAMRLHNAAHRIEKDGWREIEPMRGTGRTTRRLLDILSWLISDAPKDRGVIIVVVGYTFQTARHTARQLTIMINRLRSTGYAIGPFSIKTTSAIGFKAIGHKADKVLLDAK